jgi:putative transposase
MYQVSLRTLRRRIWLREPFTQLYLHLVWATWDRLPLITGSVREPIYACIKSKCKEVGADVFAIGGMEDHIHVLVRFPTTITVADLVKHMKGATSHLANHALNNGHKEFRWQGAYGAFTVSKSEGRRVRDYILNQESHHDGGSIEAGWEMQAKTES